MAVTMKTRDMINKELLGELMDLRRETTQLRAEAGRQRANAISSQRAALIDLLNVVGTVCEEGAAIDGVIRACIEQICTHLGWPVGDACRVAEASSSLPSEDLWYLADAERFSAFRDVTLQAPLVEAHELPGRVIANRTLIWIKDVTTDSGFSRAGVAKETGLT